MEIPRRLNGLTDHLFAMPSFLSGMGRALDLGATFDEYNWYDDPDETDANAIFSDFRAVGMDLLEACSRFEAELARGTEEHGPRS